MRVFKKRDKWWIDYHFCGRRIRKPISRNKREAEKALIEVLSDMVQRQYSPPEGEKILFIDYAKKYLKEYSIPSKKSFKNDISRLKNLMPFFGGLYLDEITSDHFKYFKSRRLKQKAKNRDYLVSPTTVNREAALLNSMLNKAVEWGMIPYNQLKIEKSVEIPKERILTREEMRLLVDNANSPLKEIITLALNTGMKKGEILNLKWNQVNLDLRYLTLTDTISKKITSRRLPLNLTATQIFLLLKRQNKESIFVFENPKTKMPYLDIKKGWYALLKKTGIKNLRFYDLRHCFAFYTLLQGGDIFALKEILGHKDISTTGRYLRLLPSCPKTPDSGFEFPL
jgi:integrase